MADEHKKGESTATTKEFSPDERTLIRETDGGSSSRAKTYPPPYLVVVDGPRLGIRFPLAEGSHIIGRAVGAGVRLDDQSVSRNHAEISQKGQSWSVKDLGSKNGTLVNGRMIADEVVLGHKDLVKTGIYVLRLITQETPLDEEMTLPQQFVAPERTQFVKSSTDEMKPKKAERQPQARRPVEGEEDSLDSFSEEGKQPYKKGKRFLVVIGVLLLAAVVLAGGGYVAWCLLGPGSESGPGAIPAPSSLEDEVTSPPPVAEAPALPPEVPPAAPADPASLPPDVPPSLPPEQGVPPPLTASIPPASTMPPAPGVPPGTEGPVPPPLAPESPPVSPETAVQPTVPGIPIFLDLASSPLSAEVTFQQKVLGKTPLRVNLELASRQTYTAFARFVMPEIHEEYTQQVEFAVENDKPVIPILFRGPIGMVRVDSLPRDVQFYLEGNFEYDRFKSRSAKMNEIVLQKPIYIPHGRYSIELRRARKLGESSQTFVQDIIYRRDFVLAEESPTFLLSVHDEDLSVFPVEIKSTPPNADVFIDGTKVGKTPYGGVFPLGEHRLSLRKEGFFEYTEALKVDINTPYTSNVELKTSIAGAHINNARAAMARALYQDAINQLAEALAAQPTPSEEASANLLLGKAYLQQGDVARARGYFEKAKGNEEQRYPAMLGLVNVAAVEGKVHEALPLLVEVMLRVQDEEGKREANALFQKVSPFRSVLYVYSDPAGATVTVNDKPVAQKTPVILHELPLGAYRLKIEKPGFLPTELNLNLAVNEFNPVIVKLKPIPQ